jgi:hypothetical protein
MPCIIHDNSSSICNTAGTAPTGRTKATDIRLYRPKLHLYYLYQITCLSVKDKPHLINDKLLDKQFHYCPIKYQLKGAYAELV